MNAISLTNAVRSKNITLRLTEAEYSLLADKAKDANCKVSQLIRFILFNNLEKIIKDIHECEQI